MSASEVVSGKSLDELMAIQEAAKNEIENAKAREISEFQALVDEIKAKAEVLGLKVKEYFIEKKVAVPKYRNPNNSEETFTGIGPRPSWLKALLVDVPKENVKEELKKYLIA